MGPRILGLNKYNPSERSCSFDDSHDPCVPAQMWFQRDPNGCILFIVFYTEACRWHRCLGCNLPSKMSSKHIGYRELMAQVDYVFEDEEVQNSREKIKKVIVSNNGSVLDHVTFSSTALMYLLAKLNLNLPNLQVLSLETRPEFVEPVVLEFISRALREGMTPTNLEVAIGIEVMDPYIRNDIFHKGLKFQTIEDFARMISRYGYALKGYFMQKPVPGMTDKDAIHDIQQAIAYMDRIAEIYNIPVNLHLNPTYVSSGTVLEQAFLSGEYTPPRLIDVGRAVLSGKYTRISIFIGLNDEGLAVSGGSFVRPGDEDILKALEEFNVSQDYENLEDAVRRNDESRRIHACA